jgi:hypothetical protein
MQPVLDIPAGADLQSVIERALAINPFIDNRVNGPAANDADVSDIHQAAFTRLTQLADEGLATRRGIGALVWGEAGIGKSHLLSRVSRWATEHANFVYLHNLQAAPEHLPRSLLRAVVGSLTQGRVSSFAGTPLYSLVGGGLLEAVGKRSGHISWDHLRRIWNGWVDALVGGEHAGLAAVNRSIYDVLFRFFYSAFRASHPSPFSRRREDGSVARYAVHWLSGQALDPKEGRELELRPAIARDEPIALADAQQVKEVLVALTSLAAAARRPFVLAFDQVDNLDTDQASALARFLEALIDAAPNLLVVTAGVRASLIRWLQSGVIQNSSWDRLGQFEIELQRINGTEAGALIRARLDAFFKPFAGSEELQHHRAQDAFFPLGRSWYQSQFQDKTDLRARDAINLAREAWRVEQVRLRSAGAEAWRNGIAAATRESSHPNDDLAGAVDQMLDERIAQLCPEQAAPPNATSDDMGELLRKVLIQCRKAHPCYGLVEVERAPLSRRQSRLYDLALLIREQPAMPSVRVGVLALSSKSATQLAGQLRRLTRELPAVDRLVLFTNEWTGLPLAKRGKEYLAMLQRHFGDRFLQLELTANEYRRLDALRTLAQQAQSGDLEVETASGNVQPLTEEQVIASNHRKDRYRSVHVLRKLLGIAAHGPIGSLQNAPPAVVV